MIGGRALDRVVVVRGDDGQGSGVLLDRRRVLTAWHVVADSKYVEVVHPSSDKPVPCHVTWAGESLDAAVLTAATDVISAGRAAPMGRLRIGEVATGTALPHCEIVGFPRIQRYGEQGEDLEYDQYRVSVLPMAGRIKGALTCELDQPAAAEPKDGTSPLDGLSGAPVFAGPVLLGVVTQVPRGRGHLRIEGAPLREILERSSLRLPGTWPEEITEVHPEDERFEARYAKDLSSQYRRTEIFGIEELGRSESRWDLDTAYLSLTAEAPGTASGAQGARPLWGPQRIETLLADRPRALLRGEAGAGKTTLVWWLAAHAANGTLDDALTDLNGLVPFVVPLREVHARGGRFPLPSELLTAGRALTDGPPEGWAHRVLAARRGLLLVDGLDEVPEPERDEARRWLATLLDRYPGTRCLATVRPNAVAKNWLQAERFSELTLLPMNDADVHAFIKAWHAAARIECAHADDGLLASLEQDLAHQLNRNTALRDLARTPLLCAVICALHRRRRGLLPTTRWQLYQAALAMLLGGRDAGRGVRHADHLRLDSVAQHTLLQRLAIWLVRTGQQQMTHTEAVEQLASALRDMPHVEEQGPPERVLRFLLDRSGLLQERSDTAIQFIHRTFQDFLAAKEFHESGYLRELDQHALDETWQDVIVLAAGHAARPDAYRLIHHLVALGDAAEDRTGRYRLHVLAARCAISVQTLDQTLMETVKGRVDALMPPRDDGEVEDLAGLGDWIVGVLPDGRQLRERAALNTVRLLTRIRSPRSRRKLRQCAFFWSPEIRSEVAKGWDLQPTEEYTAEVLEGADLHDLFVDKDAQLERLPRLGSVRKLTVRGSYGARRLDEHLPVRGLESLTLWGDGDLRGIRFLHSRKDLRALELQECAGLRDVSVLRHLDLVRLRVTGGGTALDLEPHPKVSRLEIGAEHLQRLDYLRAWPELRSLTVEGYTHSPAWILEAVYHAPKLTGIGLAVDTITALRSLVPFPHIQKLMITGLEYYTDIGLLSRVFPNLRRLGLELIGGGTLDLSPLHDMPGLRIDLWHSTPRKAVIEGAEAFGDRLRM
ncbi:NACHT domain-containing protein [Streptomyces sp. NPDC020489]|uniref:NACHT domain-containing protein n=1 Tax=Streptomyces sp. NPDC020489 TaxID=3365077 RepID=UPI0037928768